MLHNCLIDISNFLAPYNKLLYAIIKNCTKLHLGSTLQKPHIAKNFVSLITILSYRAKSFVKWITILS